MVLEPAGLRRRVSPAAADPLHGEGGGRKIGLFSFAPIKTAEVLENHSGGRASGKKVRDPALKQGESVARVPL
jgi:hypothetical protein